jgi:adenine-specific DNA-methyltransferase
MPSRKRAPVGSTPVDAIIHADKRANLPTADAYEFVTPEIESPVTVTYPRDIYSPMLVWQGKETLDDQDLEADASPIYIQEKVDPRVLIEHLRQTAKAGNPSPNSRSSKRSTALARSTSSSSTGTRPTGQTV